MQIGERLLVGQQHDFRHQLPKQIDGAVGLLNEPVEMVAIVVATAFALGVPMIGVSSLDLLAFPVRFTNRLIVATVDARRGEIYHASYRQVPGGVQRITEAQLGTADDLASDLLAVGDEVLLVGDGARRYRDVFDGLARVEHAEVGNPFPSASSLVQLAHPRALREEFELPESIVPLYLRRPDAEINWSTRDR